MGLLRTLLTSLGYPKAQSFTHTDDPSFRSLIAWLENVKIRHYPVEERKPLGDIKSDSWPAAFSKYVQDLECPIQLSADNRQAVLEWLLSFAVSLEYADNAQQLGATASKLVQQHQHHKAPEQLPFPDLHTPEVQQHLAALFKLLHVDTSKGTFLEHLQAAKEMLRDSVLPSLTDASVLHTVATGNMEHVPLGFETGDPKVDALATVLRMLYIKDLRHLQTAIDRMVVEVQEYTANPKTDASLGKVGH